MPAVRTVIKGSLRRYAERLPPAGGGRRVVVLCYHSIHPSKAFASATPEQFDEHLGWLRRHTDLVAFEQVVAAARGGPGRPAVAITFDDGYADNHQYALPVLRRHGVTADFFLTVGLLERRRPTLERFMRERSASLEEIEPLEWSAVDDMQRDDMQRAGMRFGSHTVSHPNLARSADSAVIAELRHSKERLEQQLGRPVRSLAYPYGKPRRHVTPRVVELAGQAGYGHAAVVTFRGVRARDHPLCIPRFFVTRDSLESLAAKVAGRLDVLGWWQEKSPTWAGRLLSPEDFVP
jgi:peptidoglycan/xylan/chitin deacetylase (PgdA/CDA1 family)